MENKLPLPLEGIRVVELGTNFAVPLATRLLADWGAEIIKVEGIDGDPLRTRGMQNYQCPIDDDENPIFVVPNANKKFVCIDLKAPDGRQAMLRLIETADVFISNVRYKSLSRLGLGYEALSQINPKLIYAHLSGYGNEGEEAWRPGYDLTAFWARSGALVDWTEIGGYPFKPAGAFGDFVVSMGVASGILAAVIGRASTGTGTRLDVSLYSAGVWYNAINVVSTQERYGNKYPKSKLLPHNPLACTYMGSDGNWLMIIANPFVKYFDTICGVLGLHDLVGSPVYGDIKKLKSDDMLMQQLVARISEAFSHKTTDEWYRLFNENDIPCEYLYHHADVSQDAQAWANGYLQNVTFENGAQVVMPSTPVKFYHFASRSYDTRCRLGMHTQQVLEACGYCAKDIAQMADAKIVKV
jgi:crotonobetainyl-CoA:carnitine CoA-transferase CaiB-like acyl-CoA transferase